ncbi:hypothetical protein ROZALSC1DRAFT_24201 [Rozella allomycis CSF55]|uniref:Uncharacterized protein n=1 Tax=Rozella allomycis (strain CSF55) TaxID=988480 RepID=A0A4P9YDP8_ROZAC|nr:hypothetical protein ROZALSC1DRAFT_24201 [Rozella allomycis CSF55]
MNYIAHIQGISVEMKIQRIKIYELEISMGHYRGLWKKSYQITMETNLIKRTQTLNKPRFITGSLIVYWFNLTERHFIFSKISYPDGEHSAAEISELSGPIIHNINSGNAHHDALFNAEYLSSLGKRGLTHVGIQLKCSSNNLSTNNVLNQMLIRKHQMEELDLLLWIYLNAYRESAPSNENIDLLIKQKR